MEANKEFQALLHLLDDPDEEVFTTVEAKLITYGLPVISKLEDFWENTISEAVQERIELVIHQIHYAELTKEFLLWRDNEPELLHGALLVAKFQYPYLQSIHALREIEKIRKNVWLELNNQLTPVEQVKVMDSILYQYHKLQGGQINHEQPDDYLIHTVLERKKGNAISNGIIYLILAELLDLPIKAIQLPHQFVLAYFSHTSFNDNSYATSLPVTNIKFFIDPNSGVAFSHKDVVQFYQRMRITPEASHFIPQSNLEVIHYLLHSFSKCFNTESNRYKAEELNVLSKILLTNNGVV